MCVGYDGRDSSPEFENVLSAALSVCGMDVYRVGLGPTPMLYFATHHLGMDAGMMITGSHNTKEYNGIKMVIEGKPFFSSYILELGRIIERGEFAKSPGQHQAHNVFENYITRLIQNFETKKDLTVAWDPGNGAAGEVVQRIVGKIPGRRILINEVIDGTFPAHRRAAFSVSVCGQSDVTRVAAWRRIQGRAFACSHPDETHGN